LIAKLDEIGQGGWIGIPVPTTAVFEKGNTVLSEAIQMKNR
jgi:hypothetical protein